MKSVKHIVLALVLATPCLGFETRGMADAEGLDEAPAPTSESPPSTGPALLIYLGGKDSCRHLSSAEDIASGEMGDWSRQFGLSIERAAERDGVAPNYLIACLPLLGYPGDVSYHFVRSGPSGYAHSGNLSMAGFLYYLDALAAAASGPVYLAGHSYGGWLAMKAAASLPSGVSFTTLLTIDPISANNCHVFTGIADTVRTGAPTRCNEAPADFDAAERAAIVAHTGRWLNYFQTANAYLHSSAIPEADVNVEVPFAPVGILSGLRSGESNPHLFVAEADLTWARFISP